MLTAAYAAWLTELAGPMLVEPTLPAQRSKAVSQHFLDWGYDDKSLGIFSIDHSLEVCYLRHREGAHENRMGLLGIHASTR